VNALMGRGLQRKDLPYTNILRDKENGGQIYIGVRKTRRKKQA